MLGKYWQLAQSIHAGYNIAHSFLGVFKMFKE